MEGNKEQAHLTKFLVASVSPEKVKQYNFDNDQNKHIIESTRIYKNANCSKIIDGTSFSGNVHASNNGFVNSVTKAYNQHHHLTIRPDDVWLTIMTQFSFYLNANSEDLRKKFVNFEKKKELKVDAVGTLFNAPYAILVNSFEDEIHKNLVDETVRDWIMPNFSTTSKDDRVTCGIVFMAAMKKYFDYKICLSCGIPSISLDGTVQDWISIKKRLSKLNEYGLDEWQGMLEPILEEFVQAKLGNADTDFWNRICHHEGGGSGPTYYSGWICTFCYYDQDGKKQLKSGTWWDSDGQNPQKYEWGLVETGDVPSGIVEVNVIVDDNGTEYETTMFAGSIGYEIINDGYGIQPKSGWIIALKNEKTEKYE